MLSNPAGTGCRPRDQTALKRFPHPGVHLVLSLTSEGSPGLPDTLEQNIRVTASWHKLDRVLVAIRASGLADSRHFSEGIAGTTGHPWALLPDFPQQPFQWPRPGSSLRTARELGEGQAAHSDPSVALWGHTPLWAKSQRLSLSHEGGPEPSGSSPCLQCLLSMCMPEKLLGPPDSAVPPRRQDPVMCLQPLVDSAH